MRSKLSRIIADRWKNDLFNRTQLRLTGLYSGLIILFLVMFIIIVYSLLYTVIINQQEQDMESLLNEDFGRVIDSIVNSPRESRNDEISVEGQDLYFYYIVFPNGEFIGDEAISQLRPKLLQLVQKWNPEASEIKYEAMKVTYLPFLGRDQSQQNTMTENVRLMLGGKPIYIKNQYAGTLYIGKNVTASFQLLKTLLIILSIIAVLFTVIALYISNYMSKRAMVPIKAAFLRQREFVADASHELRTPLSVMLSSIDALELEDSVDADQFSKRLLSNMKNEVKRMTRLVGDLLTLARSEEVADLRTETFDIVATANRVLESADTLAQGKNIAIQLKAPMKLLMKADHEKMTQLLYILIDNAIKYTSNDGKVDISIASFNVTQNHHICIEVKDTGIGINEDDYTRIFERFYRADKARSRQSGGHGLGLPIAKWIVESHKGTISVKSKVGEGSIFTVMIPQ